MKICFIPGTFPEISEKFIIDQVAGLMDADCEVDVVSPYGPKPGKQHAAQGEQAGRPGN